MTKGCLSLAFCLFRIRLGLRPGGLTIITPGRITLRSRASLACAPQDALP